MVEAKVRVVLGSDACAISRFVDMIRIMYLAACAHKDARADPTVIGAHKALEMTTVDAARALKWEEEIGSLEVRKRADIVILDADGPTWHPNPFTNPVANLIYSSSGSSVRTVIIDGQIILRDRELTTLDETAFLDEADTVSTTILARHNIRVSAPWPVH
jgi:5-methylthioadenosine/S-adenosylhomocysteine deaminase